MANINVTVQDGQVVRVNVGENTLAAANSANASALSASSAAASASTAQSARDVAIAAGVQYPSEAAAVAGLADGAFGSYLDVGGLPVYGQRTGSTMTPIPGPWFGADKIDERSVGQLLATTEAARGAGAVWRAGGFVYIEAAPSAIDQHITTAGGVKLYVLPGADGRYPAPAFGATAAALQRAWQVAGRQGVALCGRTYQISGLTDTGAHINIYGPGTIVHAVSASPAWVNVGGSLKLENITVNGNRINQTTRNYVFQQSAGELEVRGCLFTGTTSGAFRVAGDMERIIISNNNWRDMAEHGGILGQTSEAAYIVCNSVREYCRIINNDVRSGIPSAAGRAPAGFFVSVNGSAPVDFVGNYFENIGQNLAGNLSGCLDLYTNGHRSTVRDNRAVNSYFVPFKLQIGDDIIVSGNRVEGVDATAGAGMVVLQNVRDYPAVLKNALVSQNFIDLGDSVNLPALIVAGSSTYHSKNVIVSDLIVKRCGIAIAIEAAHQIEIENLIVENAISTLGVVRIQNTDQGSGAPLTARIKIQGGSIPAQASAAVFARTNVTNLDLSIEGVNFAGSASPIVTVRNAKALRFLENQFETGAITQLDIQNINVCRIDGNRGPSGTLAISGIIDLDYGYNPGCWDFSGKATFDPPSIPSGAVTTTTVTVTGASFTLHDAVARFSNVTTGVIINAWVTSANTVTVQFYNPTASAVDLPSGTLSARAIRRLAFSQ
jgi:hypothetical protein